MDNSNTSVIVPIKETCSGIVDDDNQEPLNRAIENDNVEEALALIQKRAFTEENLNSFLLKTVEKKNHLILKMLLDHGVQYKQTIDFKTLLQNARSQKCPFITQVILSHCGFSKQSDLHIPRNFMISTTSYYKNHVELFLKRNYTCEPGTHHDEDFIFGAFRNGHLPIVVELLRLGIDISMIHSKTELNLLQTACLYKRHEIVEILLQHNADITVKVSSKNGTLKFHLGFLGNPLILKRLFLFNNPQSKSFDVTCLHIAIFNSDPLMMDILLIYGAKLPDYAELFNLTCIAANNGCEEIVGKMLDYGINVGDIHPNGKTILHYCISFNLSKIDYGYNIVKLLHLRAEEEVTRHLKTPKNTITYDAVTNGHSKTIQLFLDYNADIQYIPPNGNTLLHDAIEKLPDLELIKKLLKRNVPVNVKNIYELTPLIGAFSQTFKNQFEIIETLLNYGADINCTNNRLRTPLHLACQDKNLQLISILLAKGANPNIGDCDCNTPLHSISSNERDIDLTLSIIKLLLEHNANINAVNKHGLTPLSKACIKGNYQVVQYLLANHANPNHTDNQGLTPLHRLRHCPRHNMMEIQQLLLEYNANIDAVDKKGWTPLFVACDAKNYTLVKSLLDNHANTSHVDLNNLTLLHVALKSYKPEIFNLLLNYNINVHHTDNHGKSVMHYVISTDDPSLFKIFTSMDANLNAVDNERNTPLHDAVTQYSVSMTHSLIIHGANINLLNKNNKTPLQEAMEIAGQTEPLRQSFSEKNHNILVTLMEHVVKLKVAGLEVHKFNLDIVYQSDAGELRPRRFNHENIKIDVQQLEIDCEQEIEKMKKDSIGIDNFTVYDLLRKHICFLSRWDELQTIQPILDREVCYEKYPLYEQVIINRIAEATLRYRKYTMMNSVRNFFRVVSGRGLPDECLDPILNYLHFGELKVFFETVESMKKLVSPSNTKSIKKFHKNRFYRQ